LKADKIEPHTLFIDLTNLTPQNLHEQPHQRIDFAARTAPVLAGKCKQAKMLDAVAQRRAHQVAHGFIPGLMPGTAW